jgi:hypothetical protein
MGGVPHRYRRSHPKDNKNKIDAYTANLTILKAYELRLIRTWHCLPSITGTPWNWIAESTSRNVGTTYSIGC